MVWNYRVIEHDGNFYIHEVYYNADGDICAISEDPMHPYGETLQKLMSDIGHFLQAITRPVLKKEKIRFAAMDGVPRRQVKRKKRSAANAR